MRQGASASSVAARMGRAAFLFPAGRIVPLSGRPPVTQNAGAIGRQATAAHALASSARERSRVSPVLALGVLAVVGVLATRLPRLPPRLPAVLALGTVAAASGPGAAALAARILGVRRSVARVFGLAATLATAWATLALTLALTISPLRGSGEGGATHGWFAWLALTIGSGTLVGMLFLSFTRLRPDPEHVGVALLGAMLFGAGIGYAADLSPLVVCGLAAALIVNGSPLRRRVRGLLAAGEHLIYGLFLIITGAVLALPTVWVLAAAPILWAPRPAPKWAGGRYAHDPLQLGAIPPQLGLATTAQGGLAVALGASFLLGDGATSGTGRPLLTTIVVGVVLAQLAAPPLMRLALRPTALTERAPGPELTAESPVD